MSFFNIIFIIYILYGIAVILHELSHFICAKCLHLRNVDIYIGEKFFAINIKRVHVSPLITRGYIEFDSDSLLEKKKWQIIILYLSGSIANILIILISLILMNYVQYCIYAIFVNFFCIILNLFPVKKLHNYFGRCIWTLNKKRNPD